MARRRRLYPPRGRAAMSRRLFSRSGARIKNLSFVRLSHEASERGEAGAEKKIHICMHKTRTRPLEQAPRKGWRAASSDGNDIICSSYSL
jgi:hypothetical protein